ncbi:MAG TPA: class F sortase [Candidatus Limnocylindrales bacterium]|nr:class F sortase [Candidatus Limnocylindrales bacterium]
MKLGRRLIDAVNYRQGVQTLAVAFMLAVSGCLSIGYGLLAQPVAASPKAVQQSSAAVDAIGKPTPDPDSVVLSASQPTAIRLDRLNINSPLIHTGLKPDGSPVVPEGENVDKASWLTTSRTPGERGTSVVLGHYDSVKSGPSVFYRLSEARAGDTIEVDRADGTTAVFRVDAVETIDRENYPDQKVYGMRDYAALNLITCSGEWDQATQSYSRNTVIFARLVGSKT